MIFRQWRRLDKGRTARLARTEACSGGTYSALYAAGRLSKQLRFLVVHLRSVENLLAFHLVKVQEARELHGR